MNPSHCGYFSSFPFVCFLEPARAPGCRSPGLARVLTRERPKSLLFRHCKSWTLISSVKLLPQSQEFTLVIPCTITSWLLSRIRISWSQGQAPSSLPWPSKKAGKELQSSSLCSSRVTFCPASQRNGHRTWAAGTAQQVAGAPTARKDTGKRP